jgi:hypothetical protein
MKADERGYRRSLPAGYADVMQEKSAFARDIDEQIKSQALEENPSFLHPTPYTPHSILIDFPTHQFLVSSLDLKGDFSGVPYVAKETGIS